MGATESLAFSLIIMNSQLTVIQSCHELLPFDPPVPDSPIAGPSSGLPRLKTGSDSTIPPSRKRPSTSSFTPQPGPTVSDPFHIEPEKICGDVTFAIIL